MISERHDVIAAMKGHPYSRFATSMASAVTGFVAGDAVFWSGDAVFGRIGHAFGATDQIASLLQSAGGFDLRWVNVPRTGVLPPGWRVREGWDFRWTTSPPAPQPGQESVVAVDDVGAINRLLDLAHPDSMVRPGDPLVRGWAGIWAGDELVSCAADRSTQPPDGSTAPMVGVLGAVGTHPAYRGRGLGAAVSAALTLNLLAAHGLVCLGVVEGNDAAGRLYDRLGYRQVLPLVSITVA